MSAPRRRASRASFRIRAGSRRFACQGSVGVSPLNDAVNERWAIFTPPTAYIVVRPRSRADRAVPVCWSPSASSRFRVVRIPAPARSIEWFDAVEQPS